MNFNPADYFVHTLAIVPGEEERCKDRVKVISNYPLDSRLRGLILSMAGAPHFVLSLGKKLFLHSPADVS